MMEPKAETGWDGGGTHPSVRIFVVENDADTLKYLTMYLEHLGHLVHTAGSMNEALESQEFRSCDVLISDIGLPDGDGWELMQRARFLHPVYAIAMSGFGMNAERVKSKSAGYRHHLLKPFAPDELDAMIAEAAREKVG